MLNKNKSMNKKAIRRVIYVLSFFLIFVIGCIGAILLINKRTADLTSAIMDNPISGNYYVNFLGFEAVEFEVIAQGNDTVDVSWNYNEIHDFLPAIAGGILLGVSLFLSKITNIWLKNVKARRGVHIE